jgi:nitrous oxidase accessory protein NosD
MILGLLLCGPAIAIDYRIDPAGDDARSGRTPESAWKTPAPLANIRLAPGDRVLLSPGTYPGPLVLRGSGSELAPVVVASIDPLNPAIIKGGDYCIDASISHLRIESLTITGATNPQRGAVMIWADRDLRDITIAWCSIIDNATRGIWIAGDKGRLVREVSIIGNRISDNQGSGLQIAKLAGGRVDQNLFLNNCSAPLEEWQAGVRLWSSYISDLTIQRNRIDNGAKTDGKGMGIHVDEVGANVVVEHNDIFNIASAGIEVENTRGVRVINNVVENAHTGIFVYRAGHDHLIERNTIFARVLGVVVQGHLAHGVNAQDEIRVDGKLATRNTIRANRITSGKYASLKISGGAEAGDNVIKANVYNPIYFQWGETEYRSVEAFERAAGDIGAVTDIKDIGAVRAVPSK